MTGSTQIRGGDNFMPIRAYVYMNTEPGKAETVANAVRTKTGVKSADLVTGRFDVLARVEANDMTALTDIVLKQILTVPGVRRTETAFVV